jgi:dTDP-4-amino-4,6-dideoxygalactose transaminase
MANPLYPRSVARISTVVPPLTDTSIDQNSTEEESAVGAVRLREIKQDDGSAIPVFVTRPYLPELSDFVKYLEQIWARKILSNDGPFHQELEQALASYFQVPHISLFANGMLALMAALKALEVEGEVITTPFSFPASTHCLSWCGLAPVFSDIERGTFTLDPEKIEQCITPRTRAILPVHVYGNPCRVQEIEDIAERHGLKVLYDAAHAFGVNYQGESLLNQGDASMLSFHATKIFNTFEGGAVVCKDYAVKKRMDTLRNHGIADEVTIEVPGLNAKMNEVQAAMGLLQLKDVDKRIQKLEALANLYRGLLGECPGLSLGHDMPGVRHNYSYFPVLIDEAEFGMTRDSVYHELKKQGIYSRRYFYPLISDLPTYRHLPSANKSNLSNAQLISGQILCLPIYADLEASMVERICDSIATLSSQPVKTLTS